MNIDDKIDALKTEEQKREEVIQENRRKLWEQIQFQAPDLAQFMTKLKKEFGKTKLTELVVNNEKHTLDK